MTTDILIKIIEIMISIFIISFFLLATGMVVFLMFHGASDLILQVREKYYNWKYGGYDE